MNQFIIFQHLYLSAHSKKAPKAPDLLKGPETAIERVTQARERRVVDNIRNRMLGGRR